MKRSGWGPAGFALCMMIMAGAARAEEEKPKILFLTHSAGFKHGSLPVAEKEFLDLGRRSKVFEGVVKEGYKQKQTEIDLSFLTPEYMNEFKGIMFFTTGELPLDDVQKEALIKFVRNGGAWIGAHSATDTFYKWPAYGETLSGGYFNGHGRNDRILILRVEDQEHPATRMLGPSLPWIDEFYQYKPESFSRERVRVLVSVDLERSDLDGQGNMNRQGDYPLVWCREVGKGRSFYTALGHRDDVWTNPVFQEHLLGGIKWALGIEPGDATPRGSR